ncbi:SDR family NAD(P)-dependent oxidoreductase [Halovulum marinum]|nr:SDR family oxidoreductase [Halovulum marinum]
MLILGGAGGIGRCLVEMARDRGWQVAIADLETSLERHPVPEGVTACGFALADPKGLDNALESAGAGLDAFVNLAGYAAPSAPLAAIDDQGWDEVISGNLGTAFRAARAVAPRLREGGAIVNTGSGLGSHARPGYGAYAVAKAGIAALTRQLATEMSPHIRVNCVAPAAVDTAFLRGGTGHGDETAPPRLDFEAYAAGNPMRRLAVPKDVAGPILFLTSPDSAYITGQTLHVNGGAYMT